MNNVGITSFGAYIPRIRLSRESIVKANSWVDPSLMMYGFSERSMCDADEDSVTMAVEAGRDCLAGMDRHSLTSLYFATTTAPFDDRQNATIIAEAVGLKEDIATLDISHSQRAGTSGLVAALRAVNGDGNGSSLYVASDHRQTRPAAVKELLFGDAAAALLLGNENVVAQFLGSQSISSDLVDHYRVPGAKYDYEWEERWVREEGYFKLVPAVIQALFEKTGVTAFNIDHFVMPCLIRGVREMIAGRMGFRSEAVRDNLIAGCGEAGTAHAIVMLVDALQKAGPGEKILVIGFGQGADALLFETTDKLPQLPSRKGVKGCLANGTIEKNYQKFLSFNDRVEIQWGMRAESNIMTRLSTAYRERKMVNGMIGGRCTACGTAQFPSAHICINPECRAKDSQEDAPFADIPAKVASYTVDWLAYTPNPPLVFGMVAFDNGATFTMQFVGFDPDKIEVGMPVEMVFRIRHIDKQRLYRSYFWKAAPKSPDMKEG